MGARQHVSLVFPYLGEDPLLLLLGSIVRDVRGHNVRVHGKARAGAAGVALRRGGGGVFVCVCGRGGGESKVVS